MMSWRKFIYETLTEDTALLALVPAGSIRAAGSVTSPPKARPFVMYRMVDETVAIKDDLIPVAGRHLVQFWAYDEEGSYDMIDAILRRIKEAISGPVPAAEDREGMVAVEWNGLGPETFDDQFKALARWGAATLVGAS